MAVFKCKMCGGDLPVKEGDKIVQCEFCGTTQTVSTSNDEQVLKLFARGNSLRKKGEFDKAYSVFEQIVSLDAGDAEAYWNLLLCKYGITYVDDYDGNKKPTINRMSLVSIKDDEDYRKVLELSEFDVRENYIQQATKISEIQDSILEIVKTEKPYDIFISYKETDEFGDRTKDSLLAQEVYDTLTKEGYRVFLSRVSLSNIAGREYEPYIYSALYTAKILILITTSQEYVNSVWVKNEWSRYISMMQKDHSKKLIPCYQGVDPYDLPKEIRNIQALDMSKLGFIQDLVIGINKVLSKGKTAPQKSVEKVDNVDINLIKQLLELGEYNSAISKLQKIIENGSTDAEVFLLKLMADNSCYSVDYSSIAKIKDYEENPYFNTALKYASLELKQVLLNLQNMGGYSDFDIDKKGTLQAYRGEDEQTVIVPDGVIVIGENAFENKKDIEKIVLPASVKVIKNNAFKGCSFLEEINLENIEKIGAFAFAETRIKKIVLSDKIRYLGSWCIGANTEHLEIPNVKIAFDEDYGILFSQGLKYVKAPLQYVNRIKGNKDLTVLEICEGPTEINDEKFIDEYAFSHIIFPASLMTFNISLAKVYIGGFNELEIRAPEIVINSEYFLQNIKLKKIIANTTVLKTIYKFASYPTEDTVNAIKVALAERGDKLPTTSADISNGISAVADVTNSLYNVTTGISSISNLAGCYVATCVYGSYDCPQVWTLRRYRDQKLGSTWYGRLFIKVYYAISPTLVKWFGHTKWFKKMWQKKLDKMVADLQAKGFESTPYDDKKWK